VLLTCGNWLCPDSLFVSQSFLFNRYRFSSFLRCERKGIFSIFFCAEIIAITSFSSCLGRRRIGLVPKGEGRRQIPINLLPSNILPWRGRHSCLAPSLCPYPGHPSYYPACFWCQANYFFLFLFFFILFVFFVYFVVQTFKLSKGKFLGSHQGS
jgi:hypothetical protein